jgi:hypothetical protein
MIHQGTTHALRDIVFFADDLVHMDRLIALSHATPDVELLDIREDVLEMHQGGKIAIRYRHTIDSLDVLLGAAGLAIAKMLMFYTDRPVMGADLSEEAMRRLEQNGGRRVAKAVARVALDQKLNRGDLTGYFD